MIGAGDYHGRAMYVYAGIDEAGYGPLLGPLVVGRAVIAIPNLPSHGQAGATEPPQLWQRLSKAVCRRVSDRRKRIAVNDSKKLTSKASGVRHLELGCLAFASLAGHRPATVDRWLDALGEATHRDLSALPWYAPAPEHPWQALPATITRGELAVARSMLANTAERIGVTMPDLGAAVVFEDRFNRMVAATRSKAAASFTFVARHLVRVWERFGEHAPLAVVDRQGGRTSYRELLALTFPDAALAVRDETPERSEYHLRRGGRSMTVCFLVEAEDRHMPVALASMVSKYTRELLMARFNAYFTRRVPGLRPTAGYATDGRRFWRELEPHAAALAIDGDVLLRRA